VNERLVEKMRSTTPIKPEKKKDSDAKNDSPNCGKLIVADRIYRTRENRAWCKERGIRISGPPLGRPPAHISKEKKKQALEDESIRNAIEGKFGSCVNEDSVRIE